MVIPTIAILPIEVQVALIKDSYRRSKEKIEKQRKEIEVLEKALERYKEYANNPHRLYVEKVRAKKKARRKRNKAKGPRK